MGYRIYTIGGYGYKIYGITNEEETYMDVETLEFGDVFDNLEKHFDSLGLQLKYHKSNEYHSETFCYLFGNISQYCNMHSIEVSECQSQMEMAIEKLIPTICGNMKLCVGEFSLHKESFLG